MGVSVRVSRGVRVYLPFWIAIPAYLLLLLRRARRHQITGIVILCLCGTLAVAVAAAQLA